MEDTQIVQLYWDRDESAITETATKYGNYCTFIAKNILGDDEAEEFGNVASKISKDYTLESIYSVNILMSVGSSEYVPHDYVLRYKNQAGGEVEINLR